LNNQKTASHTEVLTEDCSEGFTSYVKNIQDRLIDSYMEVIKSTDPECAALIEKKFTIQTLTEKSCRIQGYIEFWENLSPEEQLTLAKENAKLNHLGRRARVIGTTEIVQAHNKINADTAGSIDFVIRRFREENVSAIQVQKFIDENAVAWFSLTGHPTNPTTVEYTKAETNLLCVLSSSSTTRDDLMAALQTVYKAPIVGRCKTPLEEAEETLNTLNVIYDAAIDHKNLFEEALKKYGYDVEPVRSNGDVLQKGVKIRNPLIIPCSWTLGDGDGNSNMTAFVLEEGIRLHCCHIGKRYAENFALIIKLLEDASVENNFIKETKQLLEIINNMREHNEGPLPNAEKLIEKVDLFSKALTQYAKNAADKKQEIIQEASKGLDNLAYLVRCFGVGFGTIDIRHNAKDLLLAIARLAHIQGLVEEEQFFFLSLSQQEEMISFWLGDDTSFRKLSSATLEQLVLHEDDKTGAIAARIFGRLQVIGKNPAMCEKLIIAETTHPAHALAALLLLKAAGNEIGNEKSRIDLTILSETVKDLVGIGKTLETLLDNDLFRRQVVCRRRLLVMIAKSDTTRQDGRGEAEYMQHKAAVDIYRVIDRVKHKYPELEHVLTSIKNGGGQALQRGGGRVTEVPALHGIAAADAHAIDIGPSTLTIQGHQQGILFAPIKTAIGTLEALAAQNLYSKAGVHEEMPPPAIKKNINKQYAEADAWLYAKKAGEAFDCLAKDNHSIDELFVKAPWVSMKAGNVSSRPAKRGEKQIEVGLTPHEITKSNPKVLSGRAISGERLTVHACLPVFSVLGLAEAMEEVRDKGRARLNSKKYGDPLHHLYCANKIHRDGARATINAVAMADFDIVWPMLAGQDRPSREDVRKLAEKFDLSPGDVVNTPDITLAYLEQYFLRTEKLTYEMVTGHESGEDFQHGDALKQLWPELAMQVECRNRDAEFVRVIEAHRTREFNQNPNKPLDEKNFRITQAIYAAADVVNAPVGILATRTRLEPVDEQETVFLRPESYSEDDVKDMLKIFPALSKSDSIQQTSL